MVLKSRKMQLALGETCCATDRCRLGIQCTGKTSIISYSRQIKENRESRPAHGVQMR